jgi:prepilin-type N-terminal cleavage/methylation domain-containing protein
MIRGVGRRKGFTMTELAVVVVIVILIAAIGAPRLMTSVSHSRTRSAAQQAKNAFLFARQLSITTRDQIAVIGQEGWSRLEVRNADQNDALIRQFGLPGGTAIQAGSGGVNVTFQPRGLCVPAGSVIVGDDARAYRVVVNATARVRIEVYTGG